MLQKHRRLDNHTENPLAAHNGPTCETVNGDLGQVSDWPKSLSKQIVELGFHPGCHASEILFIPLPLPGKDSLVIGRR